jgi:hypothetical protein
MTKDPNEYLNEIVETLGATLDASGQLEWGYQYETPAEARLARKQMVNDQKGLRLMKRHINADMKSIRGLYQAQVDAVQPSALLSVFGQKKSAQSLAAQKKREIRVERDRLLEPYMALKRNIDVILLEIDREKVRVDEAIQSG